MEIQNNLINNIKEILKSNGGENLVTVDLTSKTNSIADYVIIVTGNSTRHSITLAEKVIEFFKKSGIKNIHVDGMEFANWIAIDNGKILIHIFLQEVRNYYNIEKIWL